MPAALTGACCTGDGCIETSRESCINTYGMNAYQGDESSCEDTHICEEDDAGACCFEDGSCDDLGSSACHEQNGNWLAGASCEQVGTEPGEPVSTGWDNYNTGSWSSSYTLYPGGSTPISFYEYIQYMSINYPTVTLGTYYWQQSSFLANQTEAGDWQCAGDQGFRLTRYYLVRFGSDVLGNDANGAPLANQSFNTFADFRDAVLGSPHSQYAALTSTSDFDTIRDALSEGISGSIVGGSGSSATDCYETPDVPVLACPAIIGACCVANTCTETTPSTCHESNGLYYGDATQCLSTECPGNVEPILTACCLPDGQCLDLEEAECFSVNGMAMADESCVDAISAAGGTMVSTGWDTDEIGNFDIGANSPALVPYGDTPSSLADYLQWMSINEPTTTLSTYYFQSDVVAVQTAAANWHCAGDDGFRLRKVFNVTLQDVMDPALVGTSYNTVGAIRSALAASTAYASINASSTWNDIHQELVEVNDTYNYLYSTSGQVAQDCFTVESGGFQCPAPQACCVDGACFHFTPSECEERGGQIVGDQCDDDDIVCEDPDLGACCLPDGSCNANWDERHCDLAGGSWLTGGSCEVSDAGLSQCPQPELVACCIDGTCFEMTSDECHERGGQNVGDDCDDPELMCGTPVGACCTDDGQCVEIDEAKCKDVLGTYQGDGTECEDVACEPFDAGPCGDPETPAADDPIGACCKGDTCSEATAADCADANGLWGGPDSSCDDEEICRRVIGVAPVAPASGGCQSVRPSEVPLGADAGAAVAAATKKVST